MENENRPSYPDEYVEIDGRITYQIWELMPQGDYDAFGHTISHLGVEVHHKLRALIYHRERYIETEKAYLLECIEKGMSSARIPTNLLFDFEAFLFQTKSALDIAVKLLDYLFPDSFRTHTFQDKGKKLISNLHKYADRLEKEDRAKGSTEQSELAITYRRETIEQIINLLQDERVKWLSDAIDARDTISHYKGTFTLANYEIETIGKQSTITLPKIAEREPRAFMDVTYQNLLEFLQDFFSLFVVLWLPPMFALRPVNVDQGDLARWNNLPQAKFIKYTIGIRPWPKTAINPSN
jgi:hypothetical protein